MQLNKYQSGAVSTAIYPGTLVYPALGLCGEIGELIATVVKDQGYGDKLGDIQKEMGDVLWYVANIAKDMNVQLSEVMARGNFSVGNGLRDLDKAINELPVHAGVVAENIKKAIRDNDGHKIGARGGNIMEALRLLVIWLERLCCYYGVTLEECAQLNLDKLRSRAGRGVLKGDGNDR